MLCDPKQLLLKPLGGSKGPGKLTRSHFVVGKDGKLLHAKIGVKPADSCVRSAACRTRRTSQCRVWRESDLPRLHRSRAKDALEFVRSL